MRKFFAMRFGSVHAGFEDFHRGRGLDKNFPQVALPGLRGSAERVGKSGGSAGGEGEELGGAALAVAEGRG